MTTEEVKKALGYMISDDCTDTQTEYVDEIEYAIKELERRIPKTIIKERIGNVDYPTCPICGRVIWGVEQYCATCGQLLDRSEE